MSRHILAFLPHPLSRGLNDKRPWVLRVIGLLIVFTLTGSSLSFSDDLPADVLREAQKQGIDHADQEFEKSQLEEIKNRTPDQQKRLDDLNKMLKDYDNFKNSPFANKDVVDAAEKAAAARRLQRQAAQMRAGGDPNLIPTANGLDASASPDNS